LNHVALSVPNLDEAVTYTKTLGFPEAFQSTDERGQVAPVYLQISKKHLCRAAAGQPAEGAGHQSFWFACRKYVHRNGDV
jgi:catechol 2,3-dioxygenase-like lactoylglutathione lyase family enzyme